MKVTVDLVTSECLFGPALGEDVEILQWNNRPFYTAKHGGQPQAEEHDEEENRPQRRHGHLGDGLCEHDEGQTCSFNTLQKT